MLIRLKIKFLIYNNFYIFPGVFDHAEFEYHN